MLRSPLQTGCKATCRTRRFFCICSFNLFDRKASAIDCFHAPRLKRGWPGRALAAALCVPISLAAAASAACAKPYRPQSDRQVLERLPARATDPGMREMNELRRAQIGRAHV